MSWISLLVQKMLCSAMVRTTFQYDDAISRISNRQYHISNKAKPKSTTPITTRKNTSAIHHPTKGILHRRSKA
ncbi:hypothetical protein CISIN_1g044546mg [Citrus sinensis]|uniref:Secreted protein n=1 Tax=Citrus sinensis TaxID=2711 RepID=A0A067DC90_CITSI|nr:hypothetical protein CISIN_1g044546mg [Citrus sinensis]